jgi:hypothetical protein
MVREIATDDGPIGSSIERERRRNAGGTRTVGAGYPSFTRLQPPGTRPKGQFLRLASTRRLPVRVLFGDAVVFDFGILCGILVDSEAVFAGVNRPNRGRG